MRRKQWVLIVPAASMLILACATLLPTATPTARPTATRKSTQTATQTPNIRTQENEVFCPSENEEAVTAFNEGVDLQRNGDIEGAQERYARAVEIDPQFCDAMDNLGLMYRRQDNLADAIYWYERSLEIRPDNATALQNLGLAYSFQGETQKAIETYEKLVEADPENPEGYFGLGTMYVTLEQPEKAIQNFEIAEEIYLRESSPYAADAQYYLGFSYFMLDDCATATQYYEPLYDQFSDVGAVNYVMGICSLELHPEDVETARAYILKAQEAGLEIPPDVLEEIDE